MEVFFVVFWEFELVIRFDIFCVNYFFFFVEFLFLGDLNNVVLVNESIDFFKLFLEKIENGFVKIRDNKVSESRV